MTEHGTETSADIDAAASAPAQQAGGSATSALVAIGETLDPAEVEQRLRTVLASEDERAEAGGVGLERLEGYVRLHS